MVVLKKIKSATLIETLIATVLIVVVLLIASLVINTLFFNIFHQKKDIALTRLNELEYSYLHHTIEIPYEEEMENWTISITEEKQSEPYILFIAINKVTQKEIRKALLTNDY